MHSIFNDLLLFPLNDAEILLFVSFLDLVPFFKVLPIILFLVISDKSGRDTPVNALDILERTSSDLGTPKRGFNDPEGVPEPPGNTLKSVMRILLKKEINICSRTYASSSVFNKCANLIIGSSPCFLRDKAHSLCGFLRLYNCHALSLVPFPT